MSYYVIVCRSPIGPNTYLADMSSEDPKTDVFIWIWKIERAFKFNSRDSALNFIQKYNLSEAGLLDLHVEEYKPYG